MTKELFNGVHEIKGAFPKLTANEIGDKLVDKGIVKSVRAETINTILEYSTWADFQKAMAGRKKARAKPAEKAPEKAPEKKPEKKPEPEARAAVDDRAVILQTIELNKMAWKVLHQLNAALAGERSAGIE